MRSAVPASFQFLPEHFLSANIIKLWRNDDRSRFFEGFLIAVVADKSR
jgi:hypothetical protein